MGDVQPQNLYIAPLLLPPPMIDIILGNKRLLDTKDVVIWYWYVVIIVSAYQNLCVCVLENKIVPSIESYMLNSPSSVIIDKDIFDIGLSWTRVP